MTVFEVAEILGVHPSRVRALIKSGLLKAAGGDKRGLVPGGRCEPWDISGADLQGYRAVRRTKAGRPKGTTKNKSAVAR